MIKNFQVAITVPKTNMVGRIAKDDMRIVRINEAKKDMWLRPYLKEICRFCLN